MIAAGSTLRRPLPPEGGSHGSGAPTARRSASIDERYRALAARDARFDGLFFVGVTSTGIYCRPICPARTPKPANCRFFDAPQSAEQAGFRPCLRCRPELAPGSAPIDDGERIARSIVERLEEGQFDERAGLEAIADQFELSSRQVRRIVQRHLGVPPVQLLLTRRLLLAKQLLTDTALPVTDIAFASGFASLRRFNDAFSGRYGMPPTRLRRQVRDGAPVAGDTSTLHLAYRPPYDWDAILAFLRARAIAGVEHVTGDAYARTVGIGNATGWIRVTRAPRRHVLTLELTHTLMPVLPALLGRVRALFDLDARPDLIVRHLAKDARLRAAVRARPGLRVPGAFDAFELAVRAVLGQQVTVRAATTIAGRFGAAFGTPLTPARSSGARESAGHPFTARPVEGLTHLTPSSAAVAAATVDEVARCGILASRATAIIALAQAFERGDLGTGPSRPEDIVQRLASLPGIGPWTAQYIAMRSLRWPDAFPREDIVIRRRLGDVSAREAERLSAAWSPWRSYAVMHLWGMA